VSECDKTQLLSLSLYLEMQLTYLRAMIAQLCRDISFVNAVGTSLGVGDNEKRDFLSSSHFAPLMSRSLPTNAL
jgi:hypothetical protein